MGRKLEHPFDFSIKTIKTLLAQQTTLSEKEEEALSQDTRKGVQNALKSYHHRLKEKQKEVKRVEQLREYEKRKHQQGYRYIAGVDEVGRGPLAGPVVTAAVILPEEMPPFPFDDSKSLTSHKRQDLIKAIEEYAIAISVDVQSNEVIDQLNILEATRFSMEQAVQKLNPQPDFVVTDALPLYGLPFPQENPIKGDETIYAISAASIYAKEYRDQLMREYAKRYPGYDFEHNVGYGTKKHLDALKRLGPTHLSIAGLFRLLNECYHRLKIKFQETLTLELRQRQG